MGDANTNGGTGGDTGESLKAEREDFEKCIACIGQLARNFDALAEQAKQFDPERIAFHLQLKGPHLNICVWAGIFTPQAFQWFKPAMESQKALGEQILKDIAAVGEAMVRWEEDLERREEQYRRTNLEQGGNGQANSQPDTTPATSGYFAPDGTPISYEVWKQNLPLWLEDKAAQQNAAAAQAAANMPDNERAAYNAQQWIPVPGVYSGVKAYNDYNDGNPDALQSDLADIGLQFLTAGLTANVLTPSSLAPDGTPIPTAPYGTLTNELEGSELQANHLNQNAAFQAIIPPEEGIAVAMAGNAFTDIGSPHYEFHASLEEFWAPYRSGGELYRQLPTNAEYGAALKRALINSGYTPTQAASLAAEAAAQRAAYGLNPSASVPRIPGRLPQAKQ